MNRIFYGRGFCDGILSQHNGCEIKDQLLIGISDYELGYKEGFEYSKVVDKVKLLERLKAEAKVEAWEIIEQYSGPFSRGARSSSGDVANIRIILKFKNGREEELFRGSEFSEEKYRANLPSLGIEEPY